MHLPKPWNALKTYAGINEVLVISYRMSVTRVSGLMYLKSIKPVMEQGLGTFICCACLEAAVPVKKGLIRYDLHLFNLFKLESIQPGSAVVLHSDFLKLRILESLTHSTKV